MPEILETKESVAGINFTVSCAEYSWAVAIYLFLNLEMFSILVDHDQLDIILLFIAKTSSVSAFPAISLGFTILIVLLLHSPAISLRFTIFGEIFVYVTFLIQPLR